MQEQNSAIMKMIHGKRGNMEYAVLSEEYHSALNIAAEKSKEMQKRLKDFPDLLALFEEVIEACENESAIYADEVYEEAFAFGVALGREIFSR